jgi:spermidine synthase
MVVDDGRHFVRTTDEKFDIITSDPIDPWVKGCAALNTEEYYRMCRARLKPGGVMALWMPLYESDLATTKSLIATFFKVFPQGVLWSNDPRGKGYDAVLFGSLEPIRIDVDALQAWLEAHPRVRTSLRQVGFGAAGARDSDSNTAIDLVSTYAGRPSDLRKWLHGAEINRDENLRLQYLAGMAFNQTQRIAIFQDLYRHYRFPDDLFTGSDASLNRLRQALKPAARLNRGRRQGGGRGRPRGRTGKNGRRRNEP